MLHIIVEDLINFQPNGGEGGFCYKDGGNLFVYVDSNQSISDQEMTVVHEILEYNLGKIIPHSGIDPLAKQILDGLEQLKNINRQK